MRKLYIILIINLLAISGYSQRYTISGYIRDAASGEALISATIYQTVNMAGTNSNEYGFYSISLPAGKVKLVVSYVGYKPYSEEFELNANRTLNVKLESATELDEVTVTENSVENKVESSQMSVVEVPIQMIRNLPVIFGEVDILKAIQLLPGVQSGTEGTSGFYVRGGSPDQNLILLDGVPVYNANHLFGFFSVFNADAIHNVQLYKGGFPARFGGRLSSVLDIRMKEGNNNNFKVSGSLGIIASKLTIEGPIWKDHTTFLISGRRTYLDVLAKPIIAMGNREYGDGEINAGYYFYDTNMKINHRFNNKHALYLSAYLGKDRAYVKSEDTYDNVVNETDFGLQWGNITTALRWNYQITDKLFANTTITYSEYEFDTGGGMKTTDKKIGDVDWYKFSYISGINDVGAKVDFNYMPVPEHFIKFGLNGVEHTFKPGVNVFNLKSGNDYNIDTTFGNRNIYTKEYMAYFEDDMKLGSRVKVNAGIHFSAFQVENKNYTSIQPRISARFLVNERLSVKAAFSTMTQYIHLLSNTSIGLPTDLWLPVTDSIQPQQSWQAALGVAYSLFDDFDVSIEGFYKKMENLIEYKEGASFFSIRDNWEQKVEIGEGQSYGIEFLIEKKVGKYTGWVGYTWARAYRQFENISDGKEFPYTYDRRHDASIVLNYKFNDKVDLGVTWVYGTGNATTLGIQKYVTYGENSYQLVEYYESRNNFRTPAYHRLDIGVNFKKEKKWGERTWSFGVYNAYNRKNPFFMQFEARGNKQVLVQYSLFPLIPSVSYNFVFNK